MLNLPLMEGKVKYAPKKKIPKLRYTAPGPEHCSVEVCTTLCTTHSQVLPHERFQECCSDMHGSHFIQQQEYLMGGISQVCTKPNFCKKCSPKCLPGREPYCSSTSGESRLPMHTNSLLDENNIESNENTTIQGGEPDDKLFCRIVSAAVGGIIRHSMESTDGFRQQCYEILQVTSTKCAEIELEKRLMNITQREVKTVQDAKQRRDRYR